MYILYIKKFPSCSSLFFMLIIVFFIVMIKDLLFIKLGKTVFWSWLIISTDRVNSLDCLIAYVMSHLNWESSLASRNRICSRCKELNCRPICLLMLSMSFGTQSLVRSLWRLLLCFTISPLKKRRAFIAFIGNAWNMKRCTRDMRSMVAQ